MITGKCKMTHGTRIDITGRCGRQQSVCKGEDQVDESLTSCWTQEDNRIVRVLNLAEISFGVEGRYIRV